MAQTMWNESARQALRRRVQHLTPAHQRRWGQMTLSQMMAHLVMATQMALGEVQVPPVRLPLRYPPLKQLIVYWLPWPKGAPTAPELLAPPALGLEADRAALVSLIGRFAAVGDRWSPPEHPAFGRLTRRAWGVLVYRHIDHHLKQFGV